MNIRMRQSSLVFIYYKNDVVILIDHKLTQISRLICLLQKSVQFWKTLHGPFPIIVFLDNIWRVYFKKALTICKVMYKEK